MPFLTIVLPVFNSIAIEIAIGLKTGKAMVRKGI